MTATSGWNFKLSLLDSLLQPCVGVGQRDQLVCIVK